MLTQREIIESLIAHGQTLSAAESCTGGLISAKLAGIPGASNCFRGGVTAYTVYTKTRILGISQDLITKCGVVSREVAAAMSEHVLKLFGTDFSIGITGCAGPGPDADGNPAGLVFAAVTANFAAAPVTEISELHLSGGRDEVREAAADEAMKLLLNIMHSR